MTDLTEQWKKGELPNGIYYVELVGGKTMIAYMYKAHPYKNKTVYRVKAFNGFITRNQMKSVLSEVPTYDEWKAQQNYEDYQKQCISVYENKEKRHTDDAIAYNELVEINAELKEQNKILSEAINYAKENYDKAIYDNKRLRKWCEEFNALNVVKDCKTLAQTLLKVSPEHREWLEVNFKEYL